MMYIIIIHYINFHDILSIINISDKDTKQGMLYFYILL